MAAGQSQIHFPPLHLFNFDTTAMCPDDIVTQRQAQFRSFTSWLGCKERLSPQPLKGSKATQSETDFLSLLWRQLLSHRHVLSRYHRPATALILFPAL
jgi:hypothetical protein